MENNRLSVFYQTNDACAKTQVIAQPNQDVPILSPTIVFTVFVILKNVSVRRLLAIGSLCRFPDTGHEKTDCRLRRISLKHKNMKWRKWPWLGAFQEATKSLNAIL
jgi:hypothetical protein